MEYYIAFQLFAWTVWLTFMIDMSVDWWRDKSEEFRIGNWIAAMIASFAMFTIPFVNVFMLLITILAIFGELLRWIDRRIALMRNDKSEAKE